MHNRIWIPLAGRVGYWKERFHGEQIISAKWVPLSKVVWC